MHQTRMPPADFQNCGHSIFLPKVFPRDHFNFNAVAPRQPDNVVPHLGGDRLAKAGQVPWLKPRCLHRHQQSPRMRHINQSSMQNDPIKTAKTALQLVSVTRGQIAAGLNFQLGHRFRRSSSHVASITAHPGDLSRFSASTCLLIIPRPFGSGYARLGFRALTMSLFHSN
jgi:hypothetical protein